MKFHSSILEALNHHALEIPDKVVFTWVNSKCEEQNKLTFKQLEDQSNAVAARLLKLGCQKGDRVMIAYPFGLEFLAGMFGAMKIGVIPCSIYPPNPNQLKTDMPKFRGFAADAGAKYALTTTTFAVGMTAASVLYKTGVTWIGTDKLFIKKSNTNKPKQYERFVGEPGGICFIQYTSGSTGHPKGVMISHNNLVEDIWAISRVLGTNAVGALWLPQYHDMGLVSGFMSAIYAGVHVIMASPLDFIMRPLLWTDMVETYQATHTSAPNFAYALLLKRLKQAKRNANWSHVTHAMFAAEPTQRHVVEELAQTLSIRREHVYNLYGLAEAVVFLTGGPAYPDTSGVVCCGPVDSPSVKLRIVQDGKEIEEGQVGTIWVQSPCVAAGYYGQQELTTATFANALPGYDGTWLDTGDLGRVVDGQLYVTGRSKDLIIINGKNYYPSDVELSIDDAFGDVIRPGRTSAFQHGEDSLGITVEGRKDFDKSENEDLAVQIANHVSQFHGLFASEVVVLKLGVTPKTTSGKLKRSEIRRTTIGGNWKESSILLQFQRNDFIAPFAQGHRSSFLEISFAMNGVASSEFNLNEDTGHEMIKESASVAIIGGGVAGLVTALKLAQRNIKVTVFERNEQIGGHARHTTIFGHERNPAFGMFLGSAWPNLMALTKELGVDPVPLVTAHEFRDVVGMGEDNIPEANPAEVSRFLAEMHIVYKSGNGQVESIGQYMGRNGFSHHFAVTYFLGRMITFFPGSSIQQFLDYPLDLIAWYVVAIGISTADEMVFRLRNKEYMTAFEQNLLSLGVEFKIGCSPSVIGRDKGVSISTGNGDDDILQFDKLVLAVPPNAALQVLGEHCSDYEEVLADFECPLETVVYHTDSKWAVPSKNNGIFANIPDWGAALPSCDDTIPFTASFVSDSDDKTPIYATHAYNTFNELDFATPTEMISFTHTRVTCKAIHLRKSLLRHQGRHSTYFAGGWTRGLMFHEDALVSGIQVANSILHELGRRPHPILERTREMQQNIPPTTIDDGSTCQGNFTTKYAKTLMSVFGSEVDSSKTWVENGLTSLTSAELRMKVEEEMHVVLPANFEQIYPTPESLSDFLVASKTKSFPSHDTFKDPDFTWHSNRAKLSKLQLGVFQMLGSIVILLLLFTSVVPSYFLVSLVLNQCGSTEVRECQDPFLLLLLPMSFHLCILSLSVIVMLCKFVVVGKYRHQQFDLLSWDYLHWWFLDRLVEIWESIAGQFLLGTKLLLLFYWLLGADLSWSAKIESFIREFDLVQVGSDATIGHPLKCRKFSQSKESSPLMTFRPIVVGNNCNVSGMVSLGAVIGQGSKVAKLSVVKEGAIVPEGVLASGNPAYNAGSFHHDESSLFGESMLEAFKITWTIFEAYHLFVLSYIVYTTLSMILPYWRYSGILHWILLLPMTSFLALLTSIALKWLLLGKRTPSNQYAASLWSRATNWACDFHFRTACWLFIPFFGQSRIWNIILFLHGLDVDMVSTLSGPYFYFLPSNVDFVKIRGSFVATMSLDFGNVSKQGNSMIEIISSSIGFGSNLHAGVKIVQSTIPPRSNVSDSIYDLNQVGKLPKKPPMLTEEVALQVMNVVVFASIIPCYEIGLAATASSSPVIVAFGLALAVLLQLFIWILSTRIVEFILFHLPTQAQQALLGVYLTHVWYFRVGNWLDMALHGTPMFGYYAQLMGAEVEGDLWYFGNAIYEYCCLHFKGSVIVDNSHLSGHYLDLNGLTLGDTYVSGLLHPGCYARAGSVVTGNENGPWKVFLRSDLGMQDSKPVLKESPQLGNTDRLATVSQDDPMDDVPMDLDV
ncbi:D-alanine--D-alanyl carrier protein ligase [Seminavis robusta]|uniref:D-alanine--D-alanyl carrier protein ligase n=1 Tax=Seminavis robusta TaxID=568900 RepID=A0A9N8DWD0_9STRA|nr:D-alanine--D-alanyl carrier protein ligase [Seminavis robusta]|eukprot:Sro329_g118850.1 D-alanine--D-alanyl carrier protein ligase (1807) ;mRNA; r:65774-71365